MSRQALKDSDDLVFDEAGQPVRATVFSGLWFSVDLKSRGQANLIGWKAIGEAPAIDLEKVDYYDPAEFWEPVYQQPNLQLILKPGEFYILGSKERVRVPPAYAAEMVPYDPSMGEFRVHYAGFFDPGFGFGSGEVKGTRAILEVRSHEVPYVLRDGQNIGRLIYERLLSVPARLYGVDAGSSYQYQDLGLSKQFKQAAPVPR
jgi:dCTP deaminase